MPNTIYETKLWNWTERKAKSELSSYVISGYGLFKCLAHKCTQAFRWCGSPRLPSPTPYPMLPIPFSYSYDALGT